MRQFYLLFNPEIVTCFPLPTTTTLFQVSNISWSNGLFAHVILQKDISDRESWPCHSHTLNYFRTGGPACLCSLTFHDFPSKFMSLVTWNDLPLLNRPHSLSLPSLCTCYVLCQGQCQPHCFLGLGNPSPSFRMEFRKASLLSPPPTHSSSDPEAPCTYFIIALISLDCNCHLLLCPYL